jgi:hypothetical protein
MVMVQKKPTLPKPWQGLEISVHNNATSLFSIALVSMVGRGNTTKFWSDRWLFGCCIGDLAPCVVAAVPAKICNQGTVDVLSNNSWPGEWRCPRRFINDYAIRVLSAMGCSPRHSTV